MFKKYPRKHSDWWSRESLGETGGGEIRNVWIWGVEAVANYYERPCKIVCEDCLRNLFLILNEIWNHELVLSGGVIDLDFDKITLAAVVKTDYREVGKIREAIICNAGYNISLFSPGFQFCIYVGYILNLVLINIYYYFFKEKNKGKQKTFYLCPSSLSLSLISD